MPLLKYLSVMMAATIKFMGGPITGISLGLVWYETALCSSLGMMLTVVSFLFFGDILEYILTKYKLRKQKKLFSRKNRFVVKVKRSLGLWGIAILTPALLTPVGGSIMAIGFGYKKTEIFYKMLVSALFWGVIQTLLFEAIYHYFF